MRQPRTTSGVRFGWDTTTPSPHVATTQRGEIRGYARLQPLAGWRITSPFVIGSAATATSASRSSAAQSPSPLLCDASIAIAATRLTYSQPAITQLCRGSTVSTMCVPTIRPCRPRILSLYPSRCKGSTEIIVKFGKNAQIGTKCRFFSFSGCNFVPGEGYYLEYLA